MPFFGLGCPSKFSSAVMLYCSGTCGYGWTDKNEDCHHSDANDYCILKHCNPDAVATSFEISRATNNPGFSCGHLNLGTNYGDWFGIENVHFEDSVASTHGAGFVVSNVVCDVPGNFIRAT